MEGVKLWLCTKPCSDLCGPCPCKIVHAHESCSGHQLFSQTRVVTLQTLGCWLYALSIVAVSVPAAAFPLGVGEP